MLLPNGLPFKVAWVKRPPATQVEQKIAELCLSCLVVGRPNYLKGFDRVINACEAIDTQLERSDVSITLHVVGKNASDTERLLPHNALGRIDIKLHGYVDDEALNALYRDSALCFFLSRNEGFGLPLMEALWFRCVPILSDIPIFREVMGDDFPLFDMEGAYGEAIGHFIVRLRDEEAFRQGLLEKMERVLAAHCDGYATAARKVIKLCTAPQ
jgi:glycosyltransferase involved in cell wall biosynthesis